MSFEVHDRPGVARIPPSPDAPPLAGAEVADLLVTRSDGDGTTTLALSGELDMTNAATLEELVGSVVEQQPVSVLVFDLAALRFVDSTGLRVLITARTLMAERGGRIEVCGPQPNVRRLFEVVGLVEHLAVRA